MEDTAGVIAVMGCDAPLPIVPDVNLYGPWVQLMGPVTNLSDEQLAGRDFGQLNLECALGLPGAESLSLESIEALCLKLNEWAEGVRQFTKKCQNRFKRRPWEYGNSEGQFRMLCLATYFGRNLGLRYNQAFTQGE